MLTRPYPIDPLHPIAALLAAAGLARPDGSILQSEAARRLDCTQQAVGAALARGPGVTLGTLTAWAAALGYVVEVRVRRAAR